MIAWLFNLVWLTLLAMIWPWLLYRRFVLRKSLGNWRQKLLGATPGRAGDGPCVWFHAVSVGEVLQLPQVVAELRRRIPEVHIVISTTTSTGQQVARTRFPEELVIFWPFDFSWAVGASLDRLRPDLVVLVELELWPNFLAAARRRGVPVALINGRITERSVRGYRRIRPIARWMLSQLELVAAQNELYAGRFRELGVATDRLCVTGSVKFDGVETDRGNDKTRKLRRLLQITDDELVFVAGSTHAPEERLAIDAWRQVREQFSRVRLVLVPRHQERFEEVASLVETEYRLPLARRSQMNGIAEPTGSEVERTDRERPVILLDTLGELGACWGLADVAFVGGSLTDRGGQSMIEPAGYGASLLLGPNTWNFADFVEQLVERNAAIVVLDGAELTGELTACLSERRLGRERGDRARELVLANQGATCRTAQRLLEILREREVRTRAVGEEWNDRRPAA